MDSVISILREKGLRVTTQKKDLLEALKLKPQTVLELYTAIQLKKRKIDKTTIYRILTGFVTLGFVKEIHFASRETRYELTNCPHHHHLICETCGDIKDIKLNEEGIINEVQKQSSFKITHHSLEFFGICKKCQ